MTKGEWRVTSLKAIEARPGPRNGALPCNIKVILEGEEEVGSVSLDTFVRANRGLLKCDVVVIFVVSR